MLLFKLSILAVCLSTIYAQVPGPTTTPVPILKQINKQNDDGSYSYGYEAADGSFKIETKYPSGDVAGKYGYVDESGNLREISYGASSKRGFEPQGAGIVVPPSYISEPSSNALTDGQEDDGQYREDPKIYEDPKYNSRPEKYRNSPITTFKQFHTPSQSQPAKIQSPRAQFHSQSAQLQSQPAELQSQPAQLQSQPAQFQTSFTIQPHNYQQQYQPQPSFHSGFSFGQQNAFPQPSVAQQYKPQSEIYHQQPQFSYQAYTPQPQQSFQGQNYQTQNYQPQNYQTQSYQPQNYQAQNYQTQDYNPFFGHPAQNFDPSTGSYSINFTG